MKAEKDPDYIIVLDLVTRLHTLTRPRDVVCVFIDFTFCGFSGLDFGDFLCGGLRTRCWPPLPRVVKQMPAGPRDQGCQIDLNRK